ncbi:MAG: hypothetical protein E7062_02790 [Spirochaetaceae bacterium]|nr:hypothetical protein [Spirochaetaceae bacterium]
MTNTECCKLLEAESHTKNALSKKEFFSVCCSDLMSDVIAFVKDQPLLLTGLINTQVIRTAHLMDISTICFVRGKQPTQEMIDLAEELGIQLFSTKFSLFVAAGKLYEKGLQGSV